MDSTTLGLFLGALVLLLVSSLAFTLNGLLARRSESETAWIEIDAELHRRYATVVGLVETTRTYAAHERKLLEAIVGARRAAVEAEGVAGRAEAENLLTAALTVLFTLSESYPELRANPRFVELRCELEEIEERLASLSDQFNESGDAFNLAIARPPAHILATTFGFKTLPAFEFRPRSGAVAPEALPRGG